MGKMGFITDETDTTDSEVEPLDLNDTIRQAINTLGEYMMDDNSVIKGISVSVNVNGEYTSNIKY
jgi:hypothetical protein